MKKDKRQKMADKTLQRKLQIEQQERQPGVTSCVLDGQVVHVTLVAPDVSFRHSGLQQK